jgi:hypothetical protein
MTKLRFVHSNVALWSVSAAMESHEAVLPRDAAGAMNLAVGATQDLPFLGQLNVWTDRILFDCLSLGCTVPSC